MKSKLEDYTYKKLTSEGIEFGYEPVQFELGILDTYPHWVKNRNKLRLWDQSLSIKYTPDFVGSNWVIETKGVIREDDSIKWRLFKAYLKKNNLNWFLAMPRNKKEVDWVIKLLKTWLENDEEYNSLPLTIELTKHKSKMGSKKTGRSLSKRATRNNG